MVPSGLALGINKQTWEKMTVTIIFLEKLGQGEKREKIVQGLACCQCRGHLRLVPKLKMMFGFEWRSCW